MKMTRKLVLVLTFLALPLALAASDDAATSGTEEKVPELRNQTHCPVMGGTIDSTVFTDLQGQRVYHCCPMCSESLKKDPDKFFRKAAAEGVLFENVQTACPVSGKELDTTVFTDFEGRRVFFCCEKCVEPFLEAPAEYLGKLDTPDVEKKKQNEHMDHEGHGHH